MSHADSFVWRTAAAMYAAIVMKRSTKNKATVDVSSGSALMCIFILSA